MKISDQLKLLSLIEFLELSQQTKRNVVSLTVTRIQSMVWMKITNPMPNVYLEEETRDCSLLIR